MRWTQYAVAALLCTSPVCLTASSINQLVVFGDSLSDNGNAAIALGGTLPGNYASNAFTDGASTTPATSGPFGLWVDQFASKLGVTDPQPFLAGGTNYAVASALTGHNPAFTGLPTVVPYTNDQLALYLFSHTTSASDLYTFWAGANDIDSGGNPITAANNIAANISALASDGAKQFLWLNLPLLGDTPDGAAGGPAAVAALNAASLAFDVQWATDIATLHSEGINVIGVNIEQLFAQILADPSAFGFTDVTDPAWCGPGGLASCATNNPNDFLFWDGEHPTTAGDALVADLAFKDVTTVPEPSSLALSFAAFCILLIASARLRRSRV
jgi:outer membrane lipase/esterase